MWLVSLGSGHRTHIPVPKPRAPQRPTPAQLDDPAGSPGLTSHTARCCRASRPSPGAAVPSLQGCHWHSGSLRAQPGLGIQPGLCQELYVGPGAGAGPPLAPPARPALTPGAWWLVDAKAWPGPSRCFRRCHLRWAGPPTICCPALGAQRAAGRGEGVGSDLLARHNPGVAFGGLRAQGCMREAPVGALHGEWMDRVQVLTSHVGASVSRRRKQDPGPSRAPQALLRCPAAEGTELESTQAA